VVALRFLLALGALTQEAGGAEPGTAPADAAPASPGAGWRWNGSLRARVEAWDWFDPAAADADADDNYAFLGGYARLALARTWGRAELVVEGSVPVLLGLPENSSLPPPQGQLGLGAAYRDANGSRVAFPFVRQAYVRLSRFLDEKSALRLGRFEFIEGHEGLGRDATLDWVQRERVAQRLVAHFAFSHVQRTTEGAELSRASGAWHLLAAGGRPTEGVFKLDANGALDGIWFTYAGLTRASAVQNLRLFHVYYRDERELTKVDSRPAPVRAADAEALGISTIGAHFARRFGRGDVLLYGALQTGSWGVQSHRAGVWAAEAGYQPAVRGRPWFRAGLTSGSGDHDALDDRHATFFQILPTPRIYARFPFFNMMNSEDAFVQAILRPSPRLTLRADYHRVRLSAAGDLWYSGGGAFDSRSFGFAGRPSSGRRDIAGLVDLQADFRPDERIGVSFYFGHAHGGDVVRSVYPAGASANLAFLELSRRF
jgi:hypothetical protein